MKSIITALLVLVSASFAQAMSFKQNLPSLVCQDALLKIPTRTFHVEVFSQTRSQSQFTMRFQVVDINQGTEILFEGPVTEQFEKSASAFVNENIKLAVQADSAGVISGDLTMKRGQSLVYIPVTCQKLYQIMDPIAYM